MSGVYFGVARKTSPFSIIATFWSEDRALAWIAKQSHPDDFTIVKY